VNIGVLSPSRQPAPKKRNIDMRNGVVDPDPKAVTLICGQFNLDRHLALPALRALPQAVTLRVGMEAGFSPLSDTLRLLRREVETPNFSPRRW
jgi:hypothetical protein